MLNAKLTTRSSGEKFDLQAEKATSSLYPGGMTTAAAPNPRLTTRSADRAVLTHLQPFACYAVLQYTGDLPRGRAACSSNKRHTRPSTEKSINRPRPTTSSTEQNRRRKIDVANSTSENRARKIDRGRYRPKSKPTIRCSADPLFRLPIRFFAIRCEPWR